MPKQVSPRGALSFLSLRIFLASADAAKALLQRRTHTSASCIAAPSARCFGIIERVGWAGAKIIVTCALVARVARGHLSARNAEVFAVL